MFNGPGKSKNPKGKATAAAAPACSPDSRGLDLGDYPEARGGPAGAGFGGSAGRAPLGLRDRVGLLEPSWGTGGGVLIETG